MRYLRILFVAVVGVAIGRTEFAEADDYVDLRSFWNQDGYDASTSQYYVPLPPKMPWTSFACRMTEPVSQYWIVHGPYWTDETEDVQP